MFSPEGGVPPKHSAFCGGCFSINPYKCVFGQFSQNRGRKITNRRLFPSATKSSNFPFFNIYSSPSATLLSAFILSRPNCSSISSFSDVVLLNFHHPIYQNNFLKKPMGNKLINILKSI
jgi:hypothetical protein